VGCPLLRAEGQVQSGQGFFPPYMKPLYSPASHSIHDEAWGRCTARVG